MQHADKLAKKKKQKYKNNREHFRINETQKKNTKKINHKISENSKLKWQMRSLLIFSHTGSSSDQSEAETKGEPLYKSLREAATPLNEIDIIICIINNYDCVSVQVRFGLVFRIRISIRVSIRIRYSLPARWRWRLGHRGRTQSSLVELSSLICTASERCWCRAAN